MFQFGSIYGRLVCLHGACLSPVVDAEFQGILKWLIVGAILGEYSKRFSRFGGILINETVNKIRIIVNT